MSATSKTRGAENKILSTLSLRSSVLVLLLTGCAHLVPKTVAVDRFDYSTAIMFFFTLAVTGNSDKLPLITIPVL